MKKVLVLAAAALLLATPAMALISNTLHDLSSSVGNTVSGNTNEVCVYCHTPHGGALLDAPLWNRTVANATDFYNSATLDVDTSLSGTNASDAPLCLSCHDGSSQADALTNPPNDTGAVTVTGSLGADANLDKDLSNDHPVGFEFTAAAVSSDGELFPKATIETGAMTDALSYGSGNDMWCSSCHDVHGVSGVPTFLRMSNAGSNLCLACHNK